MVGARPSLISRDGKLLTFHLPEDLRQALKDASAECLILWYPCDPINLQPIMWGYISLNSAGTETSFDMALPPPIH